MTPSGLHVRLREFVRAMRSASRRAVAAEAVLRGVTATRVPERLAGHLLELVSGWLGDDGWALISADEGRGTAWLADRGIPPSRRPMVLAIAQLAMARGKVIWTGDESVTKSRARHIAALAIPMRSRGRVVAVLVGLDRREPGSPPEIDTYAERLAPLLVLIDGMAGALDTALRLKRAELLSAIDDLTGLFNSRFLSAILRREVKRAVRTRRSLSVLFVDLDGFKGINDAHGHLYGSRALIEAARRIMSGARETDIVARYGGDEFSLILPDTGPDGALHVAQRVRDRIAGQPFLAADGINFPLTASVGVASLPEVASTPQGMLAAADAAMYVVKARGKNGIEVACAPRVDAPPPETTGSGQSAVSSGPRAPLPMAHCQLPPD